MAVDEGTAAGPVDLLEWLEREPWAFDFFQVVRRLECMHGDRPRLGRSARPAADCLRLGQEPHLTFAPSALARFRRVPGPPKLAVYFFGLFGPNGPLPLHLTAFARERARDAGDHTLSRFADLFHHRMLSFFYRAWADAQPTVEFDRPEADRFALFVGSLFGMTDGGRAAGSLPPGAPLHYAGHFASQNRSPEGLRAVLSDFFELPVRIREFAGEWTDLPEDWWCLLGRSEETGALGRTLTLGARVWECQNKFRLALGPLGLEDYRSFLPGSSRLERLAALVRGYTNDQWSFDLGLILERDEVPRAVLGGDGRLGWTTWLAGAPLDRDPDDLILDPLSGARPFREVPS